MDGHLSHTRVVDLQSFGGDLSVAVIGGTGGVGGALVDALNGSSSVAQVVALSRTAPTADHAKTHWLPIDLEREDTIATAAREIGATSGKLHLVIVASGILHDGPDFRPEKTWQALDPQSLERAFRINTIGPALVAKHFLPLLAPEPKAVFAALSARVGSISDNRLGGWHAYRASKAALNMLIRNFAIELKRSNPQALCVGLHPGTVDTGLSKPFQGNVPEGKLFTPAFAAGRLLGVIDSLSADQSGGVFAWDGSEIPS